MSRGLPQFKEEAELRAFAAEKDLTAVLLIHRDHCQQTLQQWAADKESRLRSRADDARILIKELAQAIEQVQRLERAYGALYMVQKWEEVTERE